MTEIHIDQVGGPESSESQTTLSIKGGFLSAW
jgi:hypothetical protein